MKRAVCCSVKELATRYEGLFLILFPLVHALNWNPSSTFSLHAGSLSLFFVTFQRPFVDRRDKPRTAVCVSPKLLADPLKDQPRNEHVTADILQFTTRFMLNQSTPSDARAFKERTRAREAEKHPLKLPAPQQQEAHCMTMRRQPRSTSENKWQDSSTSNRGYRWFVKCKGSSSSFKCWWKEVHEEVRRSCREFQATERGRARSSFCAKFSKDPTKLQIFRSMLRSGANSRATAYGLHFCWPMIAKTSKRMAMHHRFPRSQDLIQSVQRQVKTLIVRNDAYNMYILQDWNTLRWSRLTLLSDPAAT